MDIIIGSGNNRQIFTVATGRQMKDMAKKHPIEHAKILGNLKALVRRQPTVRMTAAAFEKLAAKNAAKRKG